MSDHTFYSGDDVEVTVIGNLREIRGEKYPVWQTVNVKFGPTLHGTYFSDEEFVDEVTLNGSVFLPAPVVGTSQEVTLTGMDVEIEQHGDAFYVSLTQ